MSTKKSPSKKPAKKTNSSKATLDKAAAELRKLKDAAKAKKSPANKKGAKPDKTPTAPTSAKDEGNLQLIAPVKLSTRPIDEILRDRVTLAHDFSSLELFNDTPIEEFIPVFDHFGDLGRKYQFVLGDLYNEGFRLYGAEFAHQMAASGRPISTLKKWGSIASNIPAALRNKHPKLEWSHLEPVAKLADKPKEQREVVEEMVKEAKGGNVPSVKVVRARVDKIKPRQKRANTPAKKAKKSSGVEKRPLTMEERDVLIDLEEAASMLESRINGAAFVLEIESEATITLREKLGAAARFLAKLEG